MSKRTFWFLNLFTTLIVGGTTGYFASQGNGLIPVIAIILGSLVIYVAKKRVQETIEDERTQEITDRASRVAFSIFTYLAAILAVIFIALEIKTRGTLYVVGYTLAISVFTGIVLYNLLILYFNKKM